MIAQSLTVKTGKTKKRLIKYSERSLMNIYALYTFVFCTTLLCPHLNSFLMATGY